jgi:competence protein CoiA
MVSLPIPIASSATKQRLPEQVVSIAGRWVSIKTFPSGDIAVRVVAYDPDVVSLVKSIAKQNYGMYSPKWKSWNVPRWRAAAVRKALLARSQTTVIAVL